MDMIQSVRITKKRVVSSEDISWQEIFTPASQLPKEKDPVNPWVGVALSLTMIGVGVIFLGKFWQLQIVKGQSNALASER